MSVILATQEAKTMRITVQSQSWQIVHKTQSQKHASQKRAGGVVQGVSSKFNLQYQVQKKKKKEVLGLNTCSITQEKHLASLSLSFLFC
jgi:hypothetical protein